MFFQYPFEIIVKLLKLFYENVLNAVLRKSLIVCVVVVVPVHMSCDFVMFHMNNLEIDPTFVRFHVTKLKRAVRSSFNGSLTFAISISRRFSTTIKVPIPAKQSRTFAGGFLSLRDFSSSKNGF